MIRRTGFILLEFVGVAIGGALVVVGFALWRASTAPIEAKFIRPYIEQAVNGANLGFAVQLTEVKLDWRNFRPTLNVRFHGVRVSGAGNAAIGAVQDGNLAVSIRNMLLGRPSLIAIDLRRAELHVFRDFEGGFSVHLEGTGTDAGDLGSVIAQMTGRPTNTGSFGQLRQIRIVDGRVLIEDRKLGISWSAPDVDVDISRTAAAMTARMDVRLALPGRAAHLLGQAHRSNEDGQTTLTLAVENFDASAAAPLVKGLAPLSALSAPLNGHANALLDRSGRLLSGEVELQGGKGKLNFPDFYPEPLGFNAIGLDLHLADGAERLVVDRFSVDLGGPKLFATGMATKAGNALKLDAELNIADVPLDRFDSIWPHGFAVGGRDWVIGHIPEGVIKSGSVHIRADGPVDDLPSIAVSEVKGAFDYSGLEVHYFPPLAPIREITGRGAFDQRGMTLSVDSGHLGDIGVSDGAIAMTGFDQDDRSIEIGLKLIGPLRTALTVLDSPPLGYMRDLGLSPDAVGGQIDVKSKFGFPLIKTLEFRQISLGVEGTLDNVSLGKVVGSRDLSHGVLNLALDKKGMNVKGAAQLSGAPLVLDWRESFDVNEPIRSRVAFQGALSEGGRKALGANLPTAIQWTGDSTVAGTVTIGRDHHTRVDAAADLGASSVTIAQLGVNKAPGQAARASIATDFIGDTLRHIPELRFESAQSTVIAAVDFDGRGALDHAALTKVQTPLDDLTATIDRGTGDDPVFAVSIRGRKLDVSSLLGDKHFGGNSDGDPRLDITLGIDRLTTGPGAGFDQVDGSASIVGGRLERAHVRANAQEPAAFDFSPGQASTSLHLQAGDAGAALAALGLTRGVRGGALRVDGETPLQGGSRLTSATLEVDNFRLVDAPILARLLNAISLSGFVDLMSGQGLAFDRLSAGMEYGDGRLTFRNGRSTGALGISFEGDVDLGRDAVALKGTVVPVDTFNRILRAIPVLGDALTGGGRGGLFGWTYSVSGSPDDPKVSVNPLSLFAPGFLRNLFFLGPREADRAAPVPATQSPKTGSPPEGKP